MSGPDRIEVGVEPEWWIGVALVALLVVSVIFLIGFEVGKAHGCDLRVASTTATPSPPSSGPEGSCSGVSG